MITFGNCPEYLPLKHGSVVRVLAEHPEVLGLEAVVVDVRVEFIESVLEWHWVYALHCVDAADRRAQAVNESNLLFPHRYLEPLVFLDCPLPVSGAPPRV